MAEYVALSEDEKEDIEWMLYAGVLVTYRVRAVGDTDIIDPPPPEEGEKFFKAIVIDPNKDIHRVYTKADLEYEWNEQGAAVMVKTGMILRVLEQATGWYLAEPVELDADGVPVPDSIKGWFIGGQRRDLFTPGWLPRAGVDLDYA